MHTAPASAHDAVAGSSTFTSRCDDGSMRIRHQPALAPCAHFACFTVPPVTVSTSSRIALAVTSTDQLNLMSMPNALAPSWPTIGTPDQRAVRALGGTVAEIPAESVRPPPVSTAPAARVTVTVASPAGSTLIRQFRLPPSVSRCAPTTSPPSTTKASRSVA